MASTSSSLAQSGMIWASAHARDGDDENEVEGDTSCWPGEAEGSVDVAA